MALKILDTCINCDVCEPACPNLAIYEGDLIYEIDPELCTECVGHFDEPQCQLLCPVDDCITVDSELAEDQQTLQARYQRLTQQA